jgi:hypothetical protein
MNPKLRAMTRPGALALAVLTGPVACRRRQAASAVLGRYRDVGAALGERDRWRETRDGRPVFGPKSPVATAQACAAVGGRVLSRIFGWMVHVLAFESDDPRVIWGGGHGHS